MSNALAIAAVTATLEAIVGKAVTADPDLNDTQMTALPPDKARGSITTNQLNLFLYQILPDAAWRNMDVPTQVKPGETAVPPLALTLHYLMTAYARENDNSEPFDHHLLGKAMSVLYDHALLGPDEIKLALPGSDLERQVERVRITLQPLSVEEISKLWTGFATQYRLSVGYEVSVALIDSTQPVKTPLPVLTRGQQDRGPQAQSDLIPPFPALDSVVIPKQQPSAKLGDTLTLTGNDLDGTNIGVMFDHALWTSPQEMAPNPGGTSTLITVKIPNLPAAWPAGFYTLAVFVQRPGETFRRTTNQLSFSLAPTITIAPNTAPGGSVAFTVTCSPEVWPQQSVSLLLGDQDLPSPSVVSQTSTLLFTTTLAKGDYFVRLRVDGVDSLLVDRSVTPPVFDPTQKVTIS
jgi:Pvc16 N-terminal domain